MFPCGVAASENPYSTLHRSVESGMLPSMPFSQRAISAPPSRPDSCSLHALGAALHRPLHRLLHRPAEAGPLLQLLRDVLGDQLGVDLRPGHLDRLDLDVPAGELLERLGQLVDLLALLADDRPDPARGDDDGHAFAGPLDADVGDRRPLLLAVPLAVRYLLDELADLVSSSEQLGEVAACWRTSAPPGRMMPVRNPVGRTF